MSDKPSYTVAEVREMAAVVYRQRGFQARVGTGNRPALVNVDLAYAWTDPESPFLCDGMDEVLRHVSRLLEAARRKHLPIFFTTTAYEPDLRDAEPWLRKIPALAKLIVGSRLVAIDQRVAPRPGEEVIVKKRASAFAGTALRASLDTLGVDTVVITGATASGCIRHTAEDAIAFGFRPIIPRETIGDRIKGAVEYNLFDIDAKFGDVEPVETVLQYLETVRPFRPRGVA